MPVLTPNQEYHQLNKSQQQDLINMTTLISLLLVALAIVPSIGLQCYKCQYTTQQGVEPGDESCNTGGKPADELVAVCPESIPDVRKYSCGKAVTSGTYNGEKYTSTERGCARMAWPGKKNGCEKDDMSFFDQRNRKTTTSNDVETYVCLCDTDKCNSAIVVINSIHSIILPTVWTIAKLFTLL